MGELFEENELLHGLRLLIALITEPLRFLTFVFLRHAHAKPDFTYLPPLLKLLLKPQSPA